MGKFADLDDTALKSLRDELGITHLWLTGVLAQATGTDYAAIGKPADVPDLLKGLAGSPYAIKDYSDVCPDYAIEPAQRMEEFRALLVRARTAGLRVLIDFVANHVARSHPAFPGVPPAGSRVSRERPNVATALQCEERGANERNPTLNGPRETRGPAGGTPTLPARTFDADARASFGFGANDDPAKFFDPKNNFFWLQRDSPGGGPPLRLPTLKDGQFISPTCRVLNAGDGLFDPEKETGRVTGNNAVTWAPSRNDWYETVKLNYGYDFTTGRRAYPHAGQNDLPVPDTWTKMDAVLAHWQALGVDGFRCDMAHMVPPEFWAWAVARARQRHPEAWFVAEGYHNDPMRVESGGAASSNVMVDLLNAGFDAVYDDPACKTLKRIYDGPAWANDLDETLAAQSPEVFKRSLRYAENHDEVRLASKGNWGGIGMDVGRAVSGVLYGLSRGPVLLYSGQEVGEPADGAEGFSSDDGRTTIFDYWCMPEFAKWVNGHKYDGGRLSPRQKSLREFYGRLLKLVGEPAFRDGEFFPLNPVNIHNPDYGRIPGESASGHWLYGCARKDSLTGQACLVVVNLHPGESFRNIRVKFSPAAFAALVPSEAPATGDARSLHFTDRLSDLAPITLKPDDCRSDPGITIPLIPPLTPCYFFQTAPAR